MNSFQEKIDQAREFGVGYAIALLEGRFNDSEDIRKNYYELRSDISDVELLDELTRAFWNGYTSERARS